MVRVLDPVRHGRAIRDSVPFPSHVVTGKGTACIFDDCNLTCPNDQVVLKPGTKVKALSIGDGASLVDAASVGRGWICAERLKALPTLEAADCKCCGFSLPSNYFPRVSRDCLYEKGPAMCRLCESAVLVAMQRSAAVDSFLALAGGSDFKPWETFILANVGSFTVESSTCDYFGPHGQTCVDVCSAVAAVVAFQSWLWYVTCRTQKELTLRERPLRLIVGTRLKPVISDASTRSFSSYLSCPFSSEQLETWWCNASTRPCWEQPEVKGGALLPRYAAWYVRPGCSCAYDFSGTHWAPQDMPEWLLDIEDAVWKELVGPCDSDELVKPNSCLLNYYANGTHSVDWHADDEPIFEGTLRDCCIVSLSLGATRYFDMRRRRICGPQREQVRVKLNGGDIITMEGMLQKHWQHRVPREPGVDAPRINFTWRTIVAHRSEEGTRCPCSV
ncbi:unnamed protein product [Prorocentrum cordatum]|uniref:Fe2OG dioxygenase domain-containing protein n=1 Tax=Prorocentrum cordatum TaxID=2364126 RepID=A0ABN9PHX9_9DINO|nr:unnamed protein product [Polarella glacialis]